jgi:hypothetical protein
VSLDMIELLGVDAHGFVVSLGFPYWLFQFRLAL